MSVQATLSGDRPRTQKTQHGIETQAVETLAGPLTNGPRTQKTQHGIETIHDALLWRLDGRVPGLRKPSTGLKPQETGAGIR